VSPKFGFSPPVHAGGFLFEHLLTPRRWIVTGGLRDPEPTNAEPWNQFGNHHLDRLARPSIVRQPLLLLVSVMYFHDKGTNRRVMLIGLMFCTAFVLVSFFAKPQPENDRVLVKADRLTLTAGKPPLAN
jgi:hypothetical protein